MYVGTYAGSEMSRNRMVKKRAEEKEKKIRIAYNYHAY